MIRIRSQGMHYVNEDPHMYRKTYVCVRATPYMCLEYTLYMCVRTCVYSYICVCASVWIVKVCVLLGSRGSIRGSGHTAQMQVIEGKEGGGAAGGGGAHVWLLVLRMPAGVTSVCMRAWIHMVLYVRAVTIPPKNSMCVWEKSARLLWNVKPVWWGSWQAGRRT